jgi:hypothetical protein
MGNMRRIIAFIGSLAVALSVTAAGLVYDAKTLALSGVFLFGLVAILWLFDWGKSAPGAASESKPSRDEKILNDAAKAAYTAGTAAGSGDEDFVKKCVFMTDSSIASVTKRFNLARPALPNNPREALKVGEAFLNEVVPYLRGGHHEEASRQALAFVSKHGRYTHSGGPATR